MRKLGKDVWVGGVLGEGMEALVQMPLDRRGDRPSAAVSTRRPATYSFITLTQEWGITAVWGTAQLSPAPASHFFWEVWVVFWPFQRARCKQS